MSDPGYEQRSSVLAATLAGGATARLRKPTSNLFRHRSRARHAALDVHSMQHVLSVNSTEGWVEAEGMVAYDALSGATLAQQCMPCVVPQLRSITLGGAIAGIGIESSSFRYGLVHETMLELDVLLGDASIVTCTPHNEHRDLFFGFPNSYGTLGYALRARVATQPVKPYVSLSCRHFETIEALLQAVAGGMRSDVDFLDAVLFGESQFVLVEGRYIDNAPYLSDYTGERIFYQSLLERQDDFLTTHDYVWRWDTDWFWCSRNLLADRPLVRQLLGRKRLNSRFYQRVMRANSRLGLTRAITRLRGKYAESVIQDVVIPLSRAAEFWEFLQRRIGILPVWLCPLRRRSPHQYPLFPLAADTEYVNFGFWDVVHSETRQVDGFYNRLVEAEVIRLGGIKSLYSDSYFSSDEFWTCYGGPAYRNLKQRYDPTNRFPDLYQKCVAQRAGR